MLWCKKPSRICLSTTRHLCLKTQSAKFVPKRRVRQHVNPFKAFFQLPIQLEHDWLHKAYKNPSLPIILDIGSAKGTWAQKMAEQNPFVNVLGLEIRPQMVEIAMLRKSSLNLKNLHFLRSNANVDLKPLLNHFTQNNIQLQLVGISFPDPHIKPSHQKRRVVNQEFVETLASYLNPGCQILLQTDVSEVQEDMIRYFDEKLGFMEAKLENQLISYCATDREIAVNKAGKTVHRCLLVFKPNNFFHSNSASNS